MEVGILNFEINDKEPIYLQIIRHIKTSMVVGTLEPGDTILSRREMAESLRVNPNTVQRAYKEMETMGLIVTERNSKSKITDNVEILNGVKLELVNEALNEFMAKMKAIKVSKDEVIEIIHRVY